MRVQVGKVDVLGWTKSLLIHEGKKADYLFLNYGTIPDPSSTENVDFNISQIIINSQLKVGETNKWNIIVNKCIGVSEETSKVVCHM